VVPIVYAIAGEPSAMVMRDYKDHPSAAVRELSEQVLAGVLAECLGRHSSCIEALVGAPIGARTTLPSLTFRAGVHPFSTLISECGLAVDDVLSVAPTATCHRVVTSDKFEVADPVSVTGRHVLVLDDVWTTGSNAQSAAVSLHRAGAAAVSVVTVARHINPKYPPTARFLEKHASTGFDPRVCPVSGQPCG
jgi:hypothetical protein